MERRLKITVFTKSGRVRIFTYVAENSPMFLDYLRDALGYMPEGGKVVVEAADDDEASQPQP